MGIIADIHKDLDRGALQLLVEYRGRLHSEAIRLCGDNALAEDLVFRTLERVLDRADTYKEDINLFAWMKSIMENIHKDDLKRPVPRGTMAIESGELEKCAGADWSTDEQILRNSDGEVVREALRHIDPKFKKLVLMRYYDEFSLKEIAGILNKPIGTIGRRIQIAHRLLAGKLAAKLGKKPVALLLAALLGIGTLFGAWVSPLGDWVSEKVFGSAPAEVVRVGVEPAGEERVASTPAPQADTDVISETQKQEGEDNMNIGANIKKTAAAAAVSAVGLAAVAPSACAAGGFTSQSYAGIAERAMYAQWDAIDNAGIGQHEASVTKWVNLVDANYNLTYCPDSRLPGPAGFSATGWTSRSDYMCYFQGCDQAWWKGTGTNFTFEAFVCPGGSDRSTHWSAVKGGIMGNYAQNGTRGLYFGRFMNEKYYYFGFEGFGSFTIAKADIEEYDSRPLLLTMVCDADVGVRMYINGELYAQSGTPSALGQTLTYNGPFYISRSHSGDAGGFAGSIHSVRVYKKCLSAEDVKKNYQIDMARFYDATPVELTSKKRSVRAYVQDKLLSQWDAIENAGIGVHRAETDRWADLCSFSVDLKYATANATATFAERGLPMTGGSAGQYFKGYGIDWWSKQTGAFTWEAYVVPAASWKGAPVGAKPRSIMGNYWQSRQYCVYFGNNGGKSSTYGIQYGAGETDGKGSAVSVPNDAIPNDRPILLTYVADGENGCKLYTNGVFCASNAAACHALNCSNVFCLGQDYTGDARGFGGTIHAVRIYTKALSQEEIKQNYDIDRLRFYDKGKGLVLIFM